MVRWGMVIDLDKCSGCQTCAVACSAENNVSLGNADDARNSRVNRWLEVVCHTNSKGEYPYLTHEMFPIFCIQCDRSPCTAVCPVAATYINPEGIVGQVYWRCIGCRYCVNACPYTCKYFNWGEPVWPGELAKSTNPDVELRNKGVTEKCLFCHHRLIRAKEKARMENRALSLKDYIPACAEACPTGALYFGDLDDSESIVSMLSREERATRLLEELGTKPKVWYLKKR